MKYTDMFNAFHFLHETMNSHVYSKMSLLFKNNKSQFCIAQGHKMSLIIYYY